MLRNGHVRFGGRAAETTSRKTGTALLPDPYTHYRLSRTDGTPGTDVEILCFIDDHSRYAISLTCHRRVTGPAVVAVFQQAVADQGIPASVLSDNGMVFTTRFAGGPTGRSHPPAAAHAQPQPRVRRDIIDSYGKISLRHNGRLHHIGVGRTHAPECLPLSGLRTV